MVKCVVSSCSNREQLQNLGLSRTPKRFFSFPSDPARVKVWLAALRESHDQVSAQNLVICEDHFLPEDVSDGGVCPDAIPIMPPCLEEELGLSAWPEDPDEGGGWTMEDDQEEEGEEIEVEEEEEEDLDDVCEGDEEEETSTATQTVTVGGTVAPADGDTASPAHRDTASPAHRDTASHAHRDTACPAHRDTASSADRDTASPAHRDTASPAHGDTGSPAHRDTASPADRDTASPADGDTASPADGDTASPADGDAASPANGDMASPADGDTASPARRDTAPPTDRDTLPHADRDTAFLADEDKAPPANEETNSCPASAQPLLPSSSSLDGGKPFREDVSLHTLTKRFLELLLNGDGSVDLREAADTLQTPKRRVYDVTNILMGIDVVRKQSVNRVCWTGKCPISSFLWDKQNIQQEADKLKRVEDTLDGLIKSCAQQLFSMTDDRDNANSAFVTFADVQNLPAFEDQTVIVVKAPEETKLEVPTPKEVGRD